MRAFISQRETQSKKFTDAIATRPHVDYRVPWRVDLMNDLLALRDVRMISKDHEKIMRDAFAYYRLGTEHNPILDYPKFKGIVYEMNSTTNVRHFIRDKLGVDVTAVPDESWNDWW